jgi:hypothetical protein
MYEVLKWAVSLLSMAALLAAPLLVMHMALNRSPDVLLDRTYEEKRARAGKWLVRIVIWLFIALGLLVVDDLLGPG